MNRGVMGRQMFAKGGPAFPDLSGDGQITQKDILMGRGVVPMSEGGATLSEEDYFAKAGLSKADYEGLSSQDQMRLMQSEMLARSMPEEPITEVPSQVPSSAGGDPMMALQARAESYGMPLEEYISILRSDPSFAEQELNAGLPVMGMAAGGVTPDPAMMAPPPGDMMAPGGEMAPPPGGEFDPAVFQGMLETAQTQFQGVDAAAENEDFGAMMNAIRGDEAPIEARYEELAEMVGPDDAQQTPESVLTLLQPVMQMAAVDQGIGGLAQDEMMAPVEGPMAEGIMSTVNMAPPPGAPAPAPAGVDPMAMAAPGGAAPVNFRQGGAVQYFNPDNENRVVLDNSVRPRIRPNSVLEKTVIQADGLDQNGSVPAISRDQALFNQDQKLFSQLLGAKDQQAAYDEQKKMTKAQMLFDIAQGALAFATPGETQMSPAERLAQVAQPVLGNISARSGDLLKFKQAQDAETRQLDMAALQSSQQKLATEKAAEVDSAAAKALALSKPIKDDDIFTISIFQEESGETKTYKGPLTTGALFELQQKHGSGNVSVTAYVPPSDKSAENFRLADGSIVPAVPGSALYNQLTAPGSGAALTGDVPYGIFTDRTQYTLTDDVTVGEIRDESGAVTSVGTTYKKGTSPYLSKVELDALITKTGNNSIVTAYVEPVNDNDYFTKYGMSKAAFGRLSKENKAYLQGLPVITDAMYFTKFGFDKNTFLGLSAITRNRLRGIEPEYKFETQNVGDKIVTYRIDINDPNATPVNILSNDIIKDPDLMKITMPRGDGSGVMITSTIDLSTPSGKAALKRMDDLNKETPGSAYLKKIGTEKFSAMAFLVPGSEAGGGNSVRMSFDGGATYIGPDGLPRQLPPNAFKLDPTQTNEIYRREKVRASAKKWLQGRDGDIVNSLSFTGVGEDGQPLNVGDMKMLNSDKKLVSDSLQKIRNGTGPYSALFAAINAVGGGFFNPEAFSETFAKTEEGRQFVRLIYVLGRSALASSPRFAVTDLEVTGTLFPTPGKIVTNSASEAKKLVLLSDAIDTEESRLMGLLASEDSVDKTVIANARLKLNEIGRLKELLGPVGQLNNFATPEEISAADLRMNQKTISRRPVSVLAPNISLRPITRTLGD